jgi:hypothetical protein
MSPDLICVLDTVSGNAFGTETIRYGMRVTVIALPAPAVFLSPKRLQHVGPRAFGYDIEFNSGRQRGTSAPRASHRSASPRSSRRSTPRTKNAPAPSLPRNAVAREGMHL